jgi:chromosomal replication initiation ATPase DnaA
MNVWDNVLENLRSTMLEEDFRRWFGATDYASDSGDQITVWVVSESIRRHLNLHYTEPLRVALTALGRRNTQIRFVVGGTDEDDEM